MLSYVIGFVTAYIAFGLSGQVYPPEQSAWNEQVSETSQPAANVKGIATTVKSDGLYALLNGRERILSAATIEATEPNLGYHYQVIGTAVSPDGKYIHYCAQLTADSEECYNFVYDTAADTIHTVRASDSKAQLTSSVKDTLAVWENGRLLIDGYMSISGFEPWKVAGPSTD